MNRAVVDNKPTFEDTYKCLTEVASGTRVRMKRLDAGCGLQHRLAAMGMLPNSIFEVIRNEGRGQLIVNVRGTRIVLGRGMAHKVFVTVCNSEK